MCEWMRGWCWVAALVFIVACGHRTLVVLVPDPDGAVGRVTVANETGSVDMDQANQATVVQDRGTAPGTPVLKQTAEIEAAFGEVLVHQPQLPVHFILHFQSDAVDLLPASLGQLPEIITAITARSPTLVSVVGHTDTMGDKAYNFDLSMRRSQAVKALLVEHGVDIRFIDVSSHGEENPLVQTADNVANARNRRVEVIVR